MSVLDSFCSYLTNIYVMPVKSKCFNVTVTTREYALVYTLFGCFHMLQGRY